MASAPREILGGICPSPFLREIDYPLTGGYLPGRLCVTYYAFNATCCVPCPLTDWTYSEGFTQRTNVGNWVNLAALFATAFLLLSFAVLDTKWTHRHYLSVCLAIGVFFIELGFIIPIGAQPEQCYNDITPHGMQSDLTCALSGSCLLFGGWAAVVWVFWRALSIHLQICWEVVPGPRFFYSALALGWGVPAIMLAITLSLTGVSYRFGNVCHINHQLGLQDFWGPLLTVAALAMVLQFFTIGYCVHVFIRSMLRESTPVDNKADVPSLRSQAGNSARQTYRRVKRVIQLQWRGASVVLLIIAEVTFFAVIFVSMDNNTTLNEAVQAKANDWVWCLVLNGGDKSGCLTEASEFMVSEGTVLAVLVCLGLSGFWCLLLLGRWSLVLGWKDLIQRKLLRHSDFGSTDARRLSNDQRTYEMLDSKRMNSVLTPRSPEPVVFSPNPTDAVSPSSPREKVTKEYFDHKRSLKSFGIAVSTDSSPLSPPHSHREWVSRSPEPRSGQDSRPGLAISKDYA